MKIVIATAVYYPMINGVATFSHNLAVGLAKRGNEVMVLCPSQTGKNYTREIDGVKTVYLRSVQIKVYPDQIHPVPKKRKIFGLELPHLLYKNGFRASVFPAIEIKKVLDDFAPDVVHIQVSDPIGLSVSFYARKKNIPIVTTEHNQPEVLTVPLKMPGVVRRPANYLLSSYFRNRQSKSDFVTMPTEQAIDNLIRSKGKDIGVPVVAVSNGVDLSNFKAGEASREIYEKYHLPEDKPIILYVGRVDPEKKIGTILEAFASGCKGDAVLKKLNAVLVVVGDGVDKARLIKKAEELGISESVRFLGKVLPPDLFEVYKTGTAFATASEVETQGIVLIEAAATGLPLIAVDRGAVREVCIDGENGYLCQAGDVEGILHAMVKILSDSQTQEKFSQNSIKIAKEHDFEKTLDKFLEIYRKVIRKDLNSVKQ